MNYTKQAHFEVIEDNRSVRVHAMQSHLSEEKGGGCMAAHNSGGSSPHGHTCCGPTRDTQEMPETVGIHDPPPHPPTQQILAGVSLNYTMHSVPCCMHTGVCTFVHPSPSSQSRTSRTSPSVMLSSSLCRACARDGNALVQLSRQRIIAKVPACARSVSQQASYSYSELAGRKQTLSIH